MTMSLIDLVRADFKTSKPADELNSRLQKMLGLPHRYGPARLAIGRSLGMAPQPKLETSFTGYGKPIKGENLFGSGADLACWIALVVEHAGAPDLDRSQVQALVAAHWARGIYALWDDWKTSLNDFDAFVSKLVERGSAGKRSVARDGILLS